MFNCVNFSKIVIAIQCSVKKYHWGKKGSNSVIARIIEKQNPDYNVDQNTAYAELWMGTHPSGPALLAETNDPLSTLLHKSPELIGTPTMTKKYGETIPFLFKVLSIEQPLSIQSHPDKELAKQLHAINPENYPDDNHKPEMAIAVSDFGALLSFRPLDEIKNNLLQYPELKAVIGESASSVLLQTSPAQAKGALQTCFTVLMNSSQQVIEQNLKSLHQRLNSPKDQSDSTLKKVFNKLYDFYPNDIGCFSLFFMNYMEMKPLDAIFLPPNEPHAYLYGDCIECMACSDNVVRAGLTPKFKDVHTLCSSLTYESKNIQNLVLKPTVVDENVSIYEPPVEEFAVECIKVPKNRSYTISGKPSASFLIVIDGYGTAENSLNLYPGFVSFIPASTTSTINIVNDDLLMFRSFCPINE
ncbi:hypothetical protein B4U80_02480 [Leptotrombidium deliense]|uniref:Mannose-6-phosphate isomerase n=1 Tax=Leptotrombidium deliense TaxID=299467 RepID=A0A443SMR1_9ACAR|nr:hypothetical protein B4U80_02480 [Leptotrombidium deliense]